MMIVAAMKKITVNLKEVVGNCIPALGDFDIGLPRSLKVECKEEVGDQVIVNTLLFHYFTSKTRNYTYSV